MIYITGDCHQDFRRFSTRIFPEQKEMTKEDYVIICGDFGGVWNKGKESREEKHLMDWLEGKSFTTLFVDGEGNLVGDPIVGADVAGYKEFVEEYLKGLKE